MKDYEPPPPIDPEKKYKYVNVLDTDGKTILKLAKDQITYAPTEEF